MARTPTWDNITTSTTGTITSGVQAFTVENTGGANGTFDGKTIYPGQVVSMEADPQDTWGSISYNGTGTTLYITYLKQ